MPALLDLMKAVGKEPVAYRIHADALDYTYTSFIRPGQLPQAGVLYICSDGIPAACVSFSSCGLIVLGENTPQQSLEELSCEYCLLPECDAVELLCRLQEAIIYGQSKNRVRELARRLVVQKPGLGIVVRRICEIIQNPIAVYDSSYNLLAMESMGMPVENKVWNLAKTKGSFPPEIVEEFRATIGDRDISRTPYLCTTHAWTDTHCLVMQLVSDSGVLLGSIAVYESFRAFRYDDVSLIEEVSRLLAAYLAERSPDSSAKQRCSELLEKLLNGSGAEPAELDRLIKCGAWVERSFYRLGYIRLSGDPTKQRQCEYFRRVLSGASEGITGVTRNRDIVLVICADEMQQMHSLVDALRPLLDKHGLSMSLSGCFLNLRDVRRMYRFALEAFDTGEKVLGKQTVYFVQDVAFYSAVDGLSCEQVRKLCEATPYSVIQAYDREQQTNYCETLVAYCMNMFHTAQTANELFIHKNSLLYRLGRVGTLFGLDLNDFHDVFEFYRGYKLSVYLEHLEKERGEALD